MENLNNITNALEASDKNSSPSNYDIDLSKLEQDLSNGNQDLNSNGGSNDVSSVKQSVDQVSSDENDIEIDPKYANLPRAEALARTWQSRYDKAQAELQKIQQQYELSANVKDLFEKMIDDENLLRVFVNQVRPGLIENRDYGQIIKEKLKQEFGEDYKPQLTRLEAERDDPGGTDWKYYKRLDQLEKELSSEVPEIKTVKEYLENAKKQKELQEQEMKLEIETIKKDMNSTDEEIKGVLNWAEKLKLKDILTLHRFLRKFHKVPEIQSPSTRPTISSPDRERFLKEIFG